MYMGNKVAYSMLKRLGIFAIAILGCFSTPVNATPFTTTIPYQKLGRLGWGLNTPIRAAQHRLSKMAGAQILALG